MVASIWSPSDALLASYIEGNEIYASKVWGIRADNSYDNSANIQEMCYQLNNDGRGAKVILPRGIINYQTDFVITNPLVTIQGQGKDCSVLKQNNLTKDGVFFNYPIIFGLPTGGGIRDLSIESGNGFISSGSYGTGSIGSGVKVRNAADNFLGFNLGIYNFGRHIQLNHCFYTQWQFIRGLFAEFSAVELDLDGTNIGASNTFSFSKFSNLGYTGPQITRGLSVKASGGEQFHGLEFTSFGYGIVLKPESMSQQVLYLNFNSVWSDTSEFENWTIDGTDGRVWSTSMTNCSAAYSLDGHGILVTGANVDSLNWLGGRIRENAKHGAYHFGGTRVNIRAAEVAANSKNYPGVYDGVNIAPNINEDAIQANRIGNYASLSNTQQVGVNIAAGTGQRHLISDNNLYGNLLAPVSYNTSSLNNEITNNTPTDKPNTNTSNAIPYSGGVATAIPAASTGYVGANGVFNAATQDSPWVVPRTGFIREIYAKFGAAPGAGQSFTYTLFVNGVATSMTFTAADSATSGYTQNNGQIVNFGDTIELRVVTSAGAAVTKHRYLIVFE